MASPILSVEAKRKSPSKKEQQKHQSFKSGIESVDEQESHLITDISTLRGRFMSELAHGKRKSLNAAKRVSANNEDKFDSHCSFQMQMDTLEE